MRQFLCIFISCFCLALPLCAQSNKMIKELESKRGALQKQIAESETLLNTTKKDVGSQLNGLAALTGQIEERKRYILAINNDMETIDRELSKLERQLVRLENDLKDKKKKYESSVQYLYPSKTNFCLFFPPKHYRKLIAVCAMCVSMPTISACKAKRF